MQSFSTRKLPAEDDRTPALPVDDPIHREFFEEGDEGRYEGGPASLVPHVLEELEPPVATWTPERVERRRRMISFVASVIAAGVAIVAVALSKQVTAEPRPAPAAAAPAARKVEPPATGAVESARQQAVREQSEKPASQQEMAGDDVSAEASSERDEPAATEEATRDPERETAATSDSTSESPKKLTSATPPKVAPARPVRPAPRRPSRVVPARRAKSVGTLAPEQPRSADIEIPTAAFPID